MDDVEHLWQLRDEADRQAQIASAAVPPAREHTGTDPSGVVRVRVGPDGALREIHLAMSWKQHLHPEEVAPAILAAITSIAAANAVEWAERLEAAQNEPAPRARPIPQWIADEADSLPPNTPASPESVLAQLSVVFDEMSSQLDAAISDGERMLNHTETARSGRGEVEVRVGVNGSIQELTLAPHWLSKAHPTNTGRQILETVGAAQRRSVAAFVDYQKQSEASNASISKYQDSRYLSTRFGLC
jgi:hypothetical protein